MLPIQWSVSLHSAYIDKEYICGIKFRGRDHCGGLKWPFMEVDNEKKKKVQKHCLRENKILPLRFWFQEENRTQSHSSCCVLWRQFQWVQSIKTVVKEKDSEEKPLGLKPWSTIYSSVILSQLTHLSVPSLFGFICEMTIMIPDM